MPAELPDVASWREAPRALTRHLEDLARWRGIAHLTLTEKGTARQRLTKNEGIPSDSALGKALRDDWLQRLVIIDPGVSCLR